MLSVTHSSLRQCSQDFSGWSFNYALLCSYPEMKDLLNLLGVESIGSHWSRTSAEEFLWAAKQVLARRHCMVLNLCYQDAYHEIQVAVQLKFSYRLPYKHKCSAEAEDSFL